MENLLNETWKPIKGYEVSNLGNVRSVDRHLMRGKGYCLFKVIPVKCLSIILTKTVQK